MWDLPQVHRCARTCAGVPFRVYVPYVLASTCRGRGHEVQQGSLGSSSRLGRRTKPAWLTPALTQLTWCRRVEQTHPGTLSRTTGDTESTSRSCLHAYHTRYSPRCYPWRSFSPESASSPGCTRLQHGMVAGRTWANTLCVGAPATRRAPLSRRTVPAKATAVVPPTDLAQAARDSSSSCLRYVVSRTESVVDAPGYHNGRDARFPAQHLVVRAVPTHRSVALDGCADEHAPIP